MDALVGIRELRDCFIRHGWFSKERLFLATCEGFWKR